ncbi:Uncharacterised protein [Vibrio cholerae]|nr:Uncharacterised protein [Vibrio cholerae]CSE01386.1 Uncharacterised protein [Vibrio cholerae]
MIISHILRKLFCSGVCVCHPNLYQKFWIVKRSPNRVCLLLKLWICVSQTVNKELTSV